MGAWVVVGVLVIWSLIAGLSAPSPNDIERTCLQHGKVVAFQAQGNFTYSKPVAVCSDGSVRVVH